MNGRKTAPWLRILALCTAIGLGGTFVWRQQQKAAPAKELPQQVKPEERTVTSSPQPLINDPVVLPVDDKKSNLPAPPPEAEVRERILMPSSKSGIISPNPEVPEPPKQRTVLPGSKSLSPIFEAPKAQKP